MWHSWEGAGGYGTLSPNDTRGREGLSKVSHDFLHFGQFSKFFRTLSLEKFTQGGGGGVRNNVTK